MMFYLYSEHIKKVSKLKIVLDSSSEKLRRKEWEREITIKLIYMMERGKRKKKTNKARERERERGRESEEDITKKRESQCDLESAREKERE